MFICFFRYPLLIFFSSILILNNLASAKTLNLAQNPNELPKEIKLGVTAGVHEKIANIVSNVAIRDGLKIKIIPFGDFFQPNIALHDGGIDANSFQHQPYLDQQVKDRGYSIVSVGKTFNLPMAVYSKKIDSIENLKIGSKISIPNDPSNSGRALLLLQAQGLIKLKMVNKIDSTSFDIIDNPKKIHFQELDAAQLPRSLVDVDAAVINTDYALLANLNPLKDSIAYESPNSPYANIISVRIEDKKKPWVYVLVKSYRSREVQAFIKKEFGNSIIFVDH